MSKTAGSFTDSLVVIYDNSNRYITKTIITQHDKREMLIEIPEDLENIKSGARLNVLIIHSEGASVFGGVLRRTSRGMCEISLFGERQRGGRASTRHNLNAEAEVTTIIINNQQEPLQKPLPIIMENLSSTGTKIKSRLRKFDAGTILEIQFRIQGRDAIIYANILRETINDDSSFSYGCQLIFL